MRRNKFDLGRNIWCVKRLGYELIREPYEVKVAAVMNENSQYAEEKTIVK